MTNPTLSETLFSTTAIRINYAGDSHQTEALFQWEIVRKLGLGVSPNRLALVRMDYSNTSLPQVALHVSRYGHRRLLVYNHGHGGLPQSTEPWAHDLFQKALDAGFDLLLTSMPGVGLNALNPAEKYWAIPWGHNYPVEIDHSIMLTPAWMHQFYEIIRDEGSYLHFFVDAKVTLPSLMDARVPAAQPGLHSGQVDLRQGVPPPKYDEISYLGLSGGGAMGLVACAVFPFDKCILVAGFLPEYLRLSSLSNWGDAEQVTRSFYSVFPVNRLLDLAQSTSKRNVYLYSGIDPCCYADPGASSFKRDYPHLDIRVRNLPFHGFEADEVMQILSQP